MVLVDLSQVGLQDGLVYLSQLVGLESKDNQYFSLDYVCTSVTHANSNNMKVLLHKYPDNYSKYLKISLEQRGAMIK